MNAIITYSIIALTLLVSLPAMENTAMKNKYLFNAYMIRHRKEWYRFFTHALLHADWIHLAMNMYVLYMFGEMVEYQFGFIFEGKAKLFYILLYFGAIIMSSLYSYERNKDNIHYNALGASGAVSAVVFAAILINPSMDMGLLFIPVRIPAWIFGGLYLLYSWYMNKRSGDGIAHDAHFWGAVFGVVFTVVLKPQLGLRFLEQVFNIDL